MFENETIKISMSDIIPPHLLMRLVDRRSLDYMELRDSIRAHGILNSILVRHSRRFEDKYEIIDGMYRFSCAKDLEFKTVPCILVSATDEEALLMQIQTGMQRPPTKRAEYAMHLKRLFAANPDLTFEAVSVILNKNPQWVRDTLKLTRLTERCQKELNAGNLPLVTAHAMCNLPQKLQDDFLPKAVGLSGQVAVQVCVQMLKEYTQRVRQGKQEKFFSSSSIPIAHLRSLKMVRSEYEQPICGSLVLSELDPNDFSPLHVWRMALAWVLHMDSDSIKLHEQREADKLAKMEAAIIERRTSRAAINKKLPQSEQDWRNSLLDS